MINVDELAQLIREVDGSHSLGAGALAEAILTKIPQLAARQPVAHGWSGWATQKPGRMPKLWGAREIADLNHDPDGDARLIFLSEQTAQGIDLGHLKVEVQRLRKRTDPVLGEKVMYVRLDEVLALIDQRNATPGVAP